MKITTTKDKSAEIIAQVRALTKKEVLIGVPNEKAPRTPDEEEAQKGEPINNATIGYINETGSPAANIPARPHLAPGIEKERDRIARILTNGAKNAISGKEDAADIALEKVGIVAESSVKNVITAVIPPPLAERTLKEREARGRTGQTPLIDTGQYRNSITHVIRDKGK